MNYIDGRIDHVMTVNNRQNRLRPIPLDKLVVKLARLVSEPVYAGFPIRVCFKFFFVRNSSGLMKI